MSNAPSDHSPTSAAAGTWASPLHAPALAAGAVRRGEPHHLDGVVFWAESRPAEGGRTAIVRHDLAAATTGDIGPVTSNIRTLVHEYGGAAWLPTSEGVLGASFEDQRLWLMGDGEPQPVTSVPPSERAVRFADPEPLADGSSVWVMERHTPSGVDNLLGHVAIDGTFTDIATGHDFYAAPTLSPDGATLAFLAWDHPNMPWDHVQLWQVERTSAGWGDPQLLLDGPALQQPRFDAAGTLHVVSDATGFWNLHAVHQQGAGEGATTRPLLEADVEFGVPSWAFGNRTYDFAADGSIWCTWIDTGVAHLGRLADGVLEEIDTGFTEFGRIQALPDGSLLALAASWTSAAAIVIIERDGTWRQLNAVDEQPLGQDVISRPELIEFDTGDGRTAHAFFFAPRHPKHPDGPPDRPPLLVLSHGGPTGNARSSLDLGIQYWTSRGVAVVDVNYGGSTGFGTEYRNRLRDSWGVVDRNDCEAAARHLADSGRVDPERLAIKGGSAGGYTTLCALVFGDTFTAGISRYGVADLASLAADTHKFEARYLDGLVGPWPEAADIYRERSPIHHTERLSTPMLVLQGSEDPVVPPSQAEQLVEALGAASVPHAYVLFEGESHGFRQADNIARALELELSFLGQRFGFTPAGDIAEVTLVAD